LRGERLQTRSVLQLFSPRLTRKAIDIKQAFENWHLIEVLKTAEIDCTKQAKEQRALQIELGQWRAGNDRLRQSIGRRSLARGNGNVVGKGVGLR
jgi:hypothetical protein